MIQLINPQQISNSCEKQNPKKISPSSPQVKSSQMTCPMGRIALGHSIWDKMSLGQKGSEQNVWDEMKGDEVILRQNKRGRIEQDKMSVGRNESDEMNGTNYNGTKW